MKIEPLNPELMKSLLIVSVSVTRMGQTAQGGTIHLLNAVYGHKGLDVTVRQILESLGKPDCFELLIEAEGSLETLVFKTEGINVKELTHAQAFASYDKESQSLLLLPYEFSDPKASIENHRRNCALFSFTGTEAAAIWKAASDKVEAKGLE